MVELVIVVMILGILAAVAAPSFFNSLVYHQVESAARRVKADLQLARNTARLTSATQTITFSGNTYTLSAAVKDFNKPGDTYAVNLADAPYDLDSVTANFSNAQTVAFDGYGTPTSGGTVVLVLKGHQCTVTLDGVSGEVTMTSVHPQPAVPADVD